MDLASAGERLLPTVPFPSRALSSHLGSLFTGKTRGFTRNFITITFLPWEAFRNRTSPPGNGISSPGDAPHVGTAIGESTVRVELASPISTLCPHDTFALFQHLRTVSTPPLSYDIHARPFSRRRLHLRRSRARQSALEMALIGLPQDVFTIILNDHLKNEGPFFGWNARLAHPRFAQEIRDRTFDHWPTQVLTCLRLLRENETEALKVKYSGWNARMRADFTPARDRKMEAWMDEMMPMVLSHMRIPTDSEVNICLPYLPKYLARTVDFLMLFSSDTTEACRELYRNQLCQAMCSANSRLDLSRYLFHQPYNNSPDLDKNIWEVDPYGMLAAAAAVNNYEAMCWIWTYIQFQLNSMAPVPFPRKGVRSLPWSKCMWLP